jgi:hypothetical protein
MVPQRYALALRAIAALAAGFAGAGGPCWATRRARNSAHVRYGKLKLRHGRRCTGYGSGGQLAGGGGGRHGVRRFVGPKAARSDAGGAAVTVRVNLL